MSLHREPLRAVPPPRPLPFLPPALASLRLPDDWAASLASSAPSLAGALFGAAWLVFLDGMLTTPSPRATTALAALPGGLATAALLLAATVNRSDLEDGGGAVFDAGDGGCGARGVTFAALLLSYGAAGAGVALTLLGRAGGWAVGQVILILVAAGVLFVAGGEGGGGGYSAF